MSTRNTYPELSSKREGEQSNLPLPCTVPMQDAIDVSYDEVSVLLIDAGSS
jgi:hypothetical protein